METPRRGGAALVLDRLRMRATEDPLAVEHRSGVENGLALLLNDAPTELQALWLQRMRHDLPAAATARSDWPIRHDHCFGRVILDAVCGAPWREVVAAPAWRHLTPAQLAAAVRLADAILADEADLAALNRASLALRRAHQ